MRLAFSAHTSFARLPVSMRCSLSRNLQEMGGLAAVAESDRAVLADEQVCRWPLARLYSALPAA